MPSSEKGSSNYLLACPFCGGTPRMSTEYDPDGVKWHYITCLQCGARIRGQWHSPGSAALNDRERENFSEIHKWLVALKDRPGLTAEDFGALLGLEIWLSEWMRERTAETKGASNAPR